MGNNPHKTDTPMIRQQQARDGCQPMFEPSMPASLESIINREVWVNYLNELNRYAAQIRNMNICTWLMIIGCIALQNQQLWFLVLMMIIFECFFTQRMTRAMIMLSEFPEYHDEFCSCVYLEVSFCQRCVVVDAGSLQTFKGLQGTEDMFGSGGRTSQVQQMMNPQGSYARGPFPYGNQQQGYQQQGYQGQNQQVYQGQPVGYTMPYHQGQPAQQQQQRGTQVQ